MTPLIMHALKKIVDSVDRTNRQDVEETINDMTTLQQWLEQKKQNIGAAHGGTWVEDLGPVAADDAADINTVKSDTCADSGQTLADDGEVKDEQAT